MAVIIFHWQKLELSQIKKLVSRILDSHMIKVQLKLLFTLIFTVVLSDTAWLLVFVRWNLSVHLNTWQNAWFSERDQVEILQTHKKSYAYKDSHVKFILSSVR